VKYELIGRNAKTEPKTMLVQEQAQGWLAVQIGEELIYVKANDIKKLARAI